MSTYRHSPLADNPTPGTVETLQAWAGQTMGGRVPAFMGLAQRTGGVYVEGAPSVEEALAATGLDFEVKLEPVFAEHAVMDEDGVGTRKLELPDWRVTTAHRKDGSSFAIAPVSRLYGPVQNTEALAVGQAILDDDQGKLVALGAYGNPVGARTYAAFQLPQGLTIGGQDPHDLFLTITNSFDRSSGLTARIAPLRLACTNETSIHFGRRVQQKFVVRHTSNARANVAVARQALNMAWAWAGEFEKAAEEMLAQQMGKDRFLVFARMVFEDKPVEEQTERTRNSLAARDEELLSILASQTNEFGRGTAYAGYQTVVEYLDHFQRTRGGEGAEARRQERIMAGQTDAVKNRAAELILA